LQGARAIYDRLIKPRDLTKPIPAFTPFASSPAAPAASDVGSASSGDSGAAAAVAASVSFFFISRLRRF